MNAINKIKSLQKEYIAEINALNDIKNLDERVKKATHLANNLTYINAGIYYSKAIEETFLELANTQSIGCKNIKHQPSSFLHVMTQAYKTGGHTRVVENWIKQSTNEQKHSVVILDPCPNNTPDCLENYTKEKNGELILFDEKDLMKKALRLREIASHYEYAILHVHMDDPTPVVAFGNPEFMRPVILFNHADHLFGLGISITDIYAEQRDNYHITKRKNIKNTFNLGVPIDVEKNDYVNKEDLRKKLGFLKTQKIIVSAGSDFKYKPFNKYFFGNTLLEIAKENRNIKIVVIGVKTNSNWKKVLKKSNNQIQCLPPISHGEEFFSYLKIADLVLDSYPLGGSTFIAEALSLGKPVLSLENPMKQFEYLIKSQSSCQTEEELIKKASLILNDKEYAKKLYDEAYNNLIAECSLKNWAQRLNELIKKCPKSHKIQAIEKEQEDFVIDDHVLLAYNHFNKLNEIKKIGMPFIFEIIKFRTLNHRIKQFNILGITLFKKTKSLL